MRNRGAHRVDLREIPEPPVVKTSLEILTDFIERLAAACDGYALDEDNNIKFKAINYRDHIPVSHFMSQVAGHESAARVYRQMAESLREGLKGHVDA
jgi:hypothetical protein